VFWLGAIRWHAINLGRRLVERAARRLDLEVIRRTPYSPIPKVPPIGDAVWETPRCMPGLTIDSAAHLQYVRTVLGPYLAEFRPSMAPVTGEAFYLDNGYYGPGDAELLYAIVRHAQPRHILELGAGYSTLVTAQASAMNARDSRPVDFVSVDPDPRIDLSAVAAGLVRLERRCATTVPLEQFMSLEADDILFVDTSHTVKLGSEVNFVVLEVLPRLRSGVLVHFHDIFLPYEYPRAWFARGTYLAEQYLLHAFLIGNKMYEVVLAAHALARRHRQELEQIVPSVAAVRYGPAAFWLRRR
jgi:hypothetical protein